MVEETQSQEHGMAGHSVYDVREQRDMNTVTQQASSFFFFLKKNH